MARRVILDLYFAYELRQRDDETEAPDTWRFVALFVTIAIVVFFVVHTVAGTFVWPAIDGGITVSDSFLVCFLRWLRVRYPYSMIVKFDPLKDSCVVSAF